MYNISWFKCFDYLVHGCIHVSIIVLFSKAIKLTFTISVPKVRIILSKRPYSAITITVVTNVGQNRF